MKAFNVDGRAKEREEQPIKIGDREFFPARRTAKVNKELRKARRDVVAARVQIDKLAAADERELTDEELDAQDQLEEKVEFATAKMVAALITDTEKKHPTPTFLQENADQSLLADLLTALITDEDAAEDPADPQNASTSS